MKKYIFYLSFLSTVMVIHGMKQPFAIQNNYLKNRSFIEQLSLSNKTRLCIVLSTLGTIAGLKLSSVIVETVGIKCEENQEEACLLKCMLLFGGGITGWKFLMTPFRQAALLKQIRGDFNEKDAYDFHLLKYTSLLGLVSGAMMYYLYLSEVFS